MTEPVALDGGVASDVHLVETPQGPIVVKAALPQLKVAALWQSDPARSSVEVAAIRAAAGLVGQACVPEILWVDPKHNRFAMKLVDPRHRNWKTELLAGRIDLVTAHSAGALLGLLHAASAREPAIADHFSDLRFFRELRLEPFFSYVAAQTPDLADHIETIAQGMLEHRSALVHGDYSPKNLLVDGPDVVILDFEVAHWGDPRFDLAFCLTHLLLKSRIIDLDPGSFHSAIAALLKGYAEAGPAIIDRHLVRITGCLLLARLRGKSPADYLDRIDREAVEELAIQMIAAQDTSALSAFLQE